MKICPTDKKHMEMMKIAPITYWCEVCGTVIASEIKMFIPKDLLAKIKKAQGGKS